MSMAANEAAATISVRTSAAGVTRAATGTTATTAAATGITVTTEAATAISRNDIDPVNNQKIKPRCTFSHRGFLFLTFTI